MVVGNMGVWGKMLEEKHKEEWITLQYYTVHVLYE